MQGDLFQFLHRDEWAPQRKMVHKRWNVLMLKIAKDIAKGCAFLHSANPPVIHRDLKSPNVLVRPHPILPRHQATSPAPNSHHPLWRVVGVSARRTVDGYLEAGIGGGEGGRLWYLPADGRYRRRAQGRESRCVRALPPLNARVAPPC
jgi:hypothetical protein